ncbi:hypothetical protein L1887_37894 [Cichorium endivia]|nr:hypothetical protein L1887_37894 [Cichorium endivia]
MPTPFLHPFFLLCKPQRGSLTTATVTPASPIILGEGNKKVGEVEEYDDIKSQPFLVFYLQEDRQQTNRCSLPLPVVFFFSLPPITTP